MDANRPAPGPGSSYGGLGAGSIVSRNIGPLLDADPREIGPYAVRGRLGQGAMGHVFLGFAPNGVPYALKVLRPDFAADRDFRRRFTREIAAARAVHSPFVNAVTDADPTAATPWLASYFIPGPPLSSAVQLAGPFAPRPVAHLCVGIGLALQAIHTAGIVHRDLKPANVLVASDGPRVIDFGIARAVDASMLTSTGMRLGTPSFMAPEQVAGSDVGAPADVWAVGGMLVYAATGRTAFGDGNAMSILYRVEHHEPNLEGLEPALAHIARACLAKDPAARPTPSQLVEMCRAALDGGGMGIPALSGTDVTGWLPPAVSRDLASRQVELASVRQMMPETGGGAAAAAASGAGPGAGSGKSGGFGGFLRRKGHGSAPGAPGTQGGPPQEAQWPQQGQAMSTGGPGQYGPGPGNEGGAQPAWGPGSQGAAPGGQPAWGTGQASATQPAPDGTGGGQPAWGTGQAPVNQPGPDGTGGGQPVWGTGQAPATQPAWGTAGQSPAPNAQPAWGQPAAEGSGSAPSGQPAWGQPSADASAAPSGQPAWGQPAAGGSASAPNAQPAWGQPNPEAAASVPNAQPAWGQPSADASAAPSGQPAWGQAAAEGSAPQSGTPSQPAWGQQGPAAPTAAPGNQPVWGQPGATPQSPATPAPSHQQAWNAPPADAASQNPGSQPAWGQPGAAPQGPAPANQPAWTAQPAPAWGPSGPSGSDMPTIVAPAADSGGAPTPPVAEAPPTAFGLKPADAPTPFDVPEDAAIAGLPPGFRPIGAEAKKLAEPDAESGQGPDSASGDVEAAFGAGVERGGATETPSQSTAPEPPAQSQPAAPEPPSAAQPTPPEPASPALADVDAAFGPPKLSGPGIPSIAPPTFATEFNLPAVSPDDPEPEAKPAPAIGIPSIAPPTFATEFNLPAVTPTDAEPTPDDAAPAASPSFGIPQIAEPSWATGFGIPDPAPTADPNAETDTSATSPESAAPTGAASTGAAPAFAAPTPPPAFGIPQIAEPSWATGFGIPDPALAADPNAETDTSATSPESAAPTGAAPTSAAPAPAASPPPPAFGIPQIAEPSWATGFGIPDPALTADPNAETDTSAEPASTSAGAGPASAKPSAGPAPIGIPQIAEPSWATGFGIPDPALTSDPDADPASAGSDAPPSGPPVVGIPQIAEPSWATGFGIPDPAPITDSDSDAAGPATQTSTPAFGSAPAASTESAAPAPDAPNPDLASTARTGTSAPIGPDSPTVQTPILSPSQSPAAAHATTPPAPPVQHAPPIPPHLQQPMTPPKHFTAPAGASTYQPPAPSGPPHQPAQPLPFQPQGMHQQPPAQAGPPPQQQHQQYAPPQHGQQQHGQPQQPNYNQSQPLQYTPPQPPPPQQAQPAAHMTVVPLPPSMASPYGAPERERQPLASDRSYPAGPKPTLHDTDPPGGGWSKNKRVGVIAGGAAVVVAGAVGAFFALSGGDSPKPGPTPPPNTASTPAAQTTTAQGGPIGAAQGADGAKDVVLRGLYAAAADRDFKTVCASQTAGAQKGAAKKAGWDGNGDPAAMCEKYFTDNWSTIDAGYLRARKATEVKPGANQSSMLVTVDDPVPDGSSATRTFSVVWTNDRWYLDAAKA